MLNTKNDTTLTVAEIGVILASARGAKAKLARQVQADKTAISHWLAGRFVSARIHRVASRICRTIVTKRNPGGQSVGTATRTNKTKTPAQNAGVRKGASRVSVQGRGK